MKLATIAACVGLIISLLTLAEVIYTAGRERERLGNVLQHFCEQIVVLQKITVSEHPEYTVTMTWDKCQ